MAIRTTPAAAATKWSQRASTAGANYQAGATAAAQDQVTNAVSQAQSWLDGVNQSGTKAYTAGVEAAGAANKYASRVASVGASRFQAGVALPASQTNFQNQITKVLNVENSVQLGPKGPKGSVQNQQRSTAMQTALHAAKVSGQFSPRQ